MSSIRILSVSILLVLLHTGTAAVEVKKITLESFSLFQKGSFNSALLDHQGKLRIGPGSQRIEGPVKEYYLCFDIDEQGDLLLGCGHGAEIFRISHLDKKPVSLFRADEPDIHAVLQHSSGAVIAATGPNGKLYSIDEKGNSTVLLDPKERFIWDAIEDQDGSVIVAVGGNGGVYRVTLSGKATRIFETDDPHITTLHLSADNILYAGSGESGIVYTITRNKTRVLYDSVYKEIRGITSDQKANVYFAASHYSEESDKKNGKEPEPIKSAGKGDPIPGLRSVIYKYMPNGGIEEIFSLNNETIFDIDFDSKTQQLYAASGNSGRVFRIQPTGEFAIVYESDAAQVYRLRTKGPGITMITDNSAGIVRLNDSNSSSGSYVSDVFDLTIQSDIGKLYWQDYRPEGAQVAVTIRAGNSSKPDKTWTEWLPPLLSGDGVPTNLSAYRFVQFKVSLNASSSGREPFLDRLYFYYLQNNLTPRLSSVQIAYRSIKKPEPPSKPEESKLEGNIKTGPKDLVVTWSCQDPNDDPLLYSILLSPAHGDRWFTFRSNLRQNMTVIPRDLFQDGQYQLKVVASDALTNPLGLARKSEIVSSTFTIDSTPPEITQFNSAKNQITFTANDSTSAIRMVQYSWEGEDWLPVFPDDLIGDSRTETFSVRPEASAKMIFIRVEDEQGNGKVFQKGLK